MTSGRGETADRLRERLVEWADAIDKDRGFATGVTYDLREAAVALASASAPPEPPKDPDPNHSPAATRGVHGGVGEVDARAGSRGAEAFADTRRPGFPAPSYLVGLEAVAEAARRENVILREVMRDLAPLIERLGRWFSEGCPDDDKEALIAFARTAEIGIEASCAALVAVRSGDEPA